LFLCITPVPDDDETSGTQPIYETLTFCSPSIRDALAFYYAPHKFRYRAAESAGIWNRIVPGFIPRARINTIENDKHDAKSTTSKNRWPCPAYFKSHRRQTLERLNT